MANRQRSDSVRIRKASRRAAILVALTGSVEAPVSPTAMNVRAGCSVRLATGSSAPSFATGRHTASVSPLRSSTVPAARLALIWISRSRFRLEMRYGGPMRRPTAPPGPHVVAVTLPIRVLPTGNR